MFTCYNCENIGIPMTITHSYEKELESLILDVLLPAYSKYQKSVGNTTPLKAINPKLLNQIVSKKRLPALLRAAEI